MRGSNQAGSGAAQPIPSLWILNHMQKKLRLLHMFGWQVTRIISKLVDQVVTGPLKAQHDNIVAPSLLDEVRKGLMANAYVIEAGCASWKTPSHIRVMRSGENTEPSPILPQAMVNKLQRALGLDQPTQYVVVMARVDTVRGAGINVSSEDLGSASRKNVHV